MHLINFANILVFFSILSACLPVLAQTNRQVQELHGAIEDGRGNIYTLQGLKKGDTLYAYMTNTSGNLDPMLGILNKEIDRNVLWDRFTAVVENSEKNLIKAFSRFADDHFVAWNDDNKEGYDAVLTFPIPADGTYYILAASMITNQHLDAFAPHLTAGSYRLLLGLNASDVIAGKGKSTGNLIAQAGKETKPSSQVQHLDLTLTTEKRFAFHRLIDLQPGDSLYVWLSSTNDTPLPRVYLSDFGGKPLAMGDTDRSVNAVAFSHHSQKMLDSPILFIDGSQTDQGQAIGSYRLTAGINAPEVLTGDATEGGSSVIRQSTPVKISLSVDQIVDVNQQSENFTIVGSLELKWQDADMAFRPDKCRCVVKKVEIDDLRSFAAEKNVILPVITFFNQQGNRWAQNRIVFIDPSGLTTYRERFTVTLQAPDFDFKAYPFDRQQFHVRIDLTVPTEVFTLYTAGQPGNSLGDQLGEEQWSVVKVTQGITEIPLDKNLKSSRFTLTMEVTRHLNFYLFRIFLPIFLIIGVSWVIFFLKDYGRQLEVASGNLLVFVAFNFTISDDLPRLGYLTLLDRLIITSFACAALVVFISVCQKRLEARGNKALAARIDNWVLILYPLLYLLLVALEYFMETR